MSDPEPVAEIERLAFRAWPAAVETTIGGWLVRRSDGIPSRRTNSATSGPAASADLDASIAQVEQWYRSARRRVVFRVLSTSPPEIDRALAARGLVVESPTLVMTAAVEPPSQPAAVEVSPRPTGEWMASKQQLADASDDRMAAWRERAASIEPAAGFAMIREGAEVIAIGIGVAEDDWVGLFDLNTVPLRRRQGYGARLVAGLWEWAARHGATQSYLQVQDDNEVAARLYGSLGYREAYRYWYRVPSD